MSVFKSRLLTCHAISILASLAEFREPASSSSIATISLSTTWLMRRFGYCVFYMLLGSGLRTRS